MREYENRLWRHYVPAFVLLRSEKLVGVCNGQFIHMNFILFMIEWANAYVVVIICGTSVIMEYLRSFVFEIKGALLLSHHKCANLPYFLGFLTLCLGS